MNARDKVEKTNHTIGIIGYRGFVGKAIVSLLEDKYLLIKGSRNKNIQEESTFYVDAYDDRSLEKFCSKCTVLINAAGPSYIIGDRIAKVACVLGVKYVDIFGGNLLHEKIFAYAEKGRFIICAGSVPGLTGILTRYLTEKFSAGHQKIEIYQGGRESGGIGGLTDIILSMLGGYGHSGKQIINDEIVQCDLNTSDKVLVNGIPETVYANPYLTEEMISIAKSYNDLSISSYQIFPDKESMELLTVGSIRYISSKSEAEKLQILSEIFRSQEHFITEKAKWFVILLNAENDSKKCRICIKTQNSTALTALIAAMSAERLMAEEEMYGLNWAYELLEAENVIWRLKDMGTLAEIECIEKDLSHVEMIEGII